MNDESAGDQSPEGDESVTELNPLFAADEGADDGASGEGADDQGSADGGAADDDGEPTEALFDDEGDDGDADADATMKVSTFKKRIGKVISQREDARKAARQAEERATAAERRAAEAAGALSSYRQAYAAQPQLAVFDSQFMEGLEVLAKTHPEVASVAQSVKEFVETGSYKGVKMTTQQPAAQQPTAANTQQPAASNAAQTAIEMLTRQTVTTTLKELGVKPAFQRLVADHIIQSGVDLAKLDTAAIVSHSKVFFKEKGLSSGDVLDKRVKGGKADEGGKAKPATGGRSAAATQQGIEKKKGVPSAGAQGKQPTRDEWRADRESRLREFELEQGWRSE